MNSKRGFKRITFALAAVAALTSGIFAGMFPYTKCQTSRSLWGLDDPIVVKEPSEQELQQFNTWEREMGITFNDYYVLVVPEDNMNYDVSLPTLMEARKTILRTQKAKYWKSLSKPKLVGLVVLYSLGGLIVSFLGVWLILWFGGLAIYKLFNWLVLGFCDDMNSKQFESMKAG